MSESTPYNFDLLDKDLTYTFPISAPNVLAGLNPNYSGFMPGGSPFSSFGSGFDFEQISKLDPTAQMLAINFAENRYQGDPKRIAEAYREISPIKREEAKLAQELGKESVLYGAAIKSVLDLPKIIAQGTGQLNRASLAGKQAILDQAQRPYNIGGFSMPYNTYRI